jgi:hypothetical protein
VYLDAPEQHTTWTGNCLSRVEHHLHHAQHFSEARSYYTYAPHRPYSFVRLVIFLNGQGRSALSDRYRRLTGMDQRTAETSHPCLVCRDQGCLSKEALCWVQHCRLEAIIGDTLMALHYPVARASRYTKGSRVSIRRLCASNIVCNLSTQAK